MLTFTAQACGLFDSSNCDTFSKSIQSFILPSMRAIAIGIAIIYLLYGAIQYITSAGDEKATKAATGTLTNAAIGLAVALLVVMIIQVFLSVLGTDTKNLSVPSIIPTK